MSPYVVLNLSDHDSMTIKSDSFLGLAKINISDLKQFYDENDSDYTTVKEFVSYGPVP